jgi:hypothetical protein
MPGSLDELHVPCGECSNEAGVLRLRGPATDALLIRTSFTSEMTEPVSEQRYARLRALLGRGDTATLYVEDPELTPFWCPDRARSFCGDCWQTTNVFDDETGGLDCIRGTCPFGHERMLED